MKKHGNRFEVAVFPILDAVLFPGVSLPINVAQKQYSQLLTDVPARKWPVAVSLVVHQGMGDFFFNDICGAGPLEILKQGENGESEILIHGTSRIRLLKVLQREPYFVMEAESITPFDLRAASRRRVRDLIESVRSWIFLNPSVSDELVGLFDDFETVGENTDFFVFHFVGSAKEKQVYLNCTDQIERAERLASFLTRDVCRLERKTLKEMRRCLIH